MTSCDSRITTAGSEAAEFRSPPADRAVIAAVIVSYNPDPAQFEHLIASIRPQVSRVVIIDNGSDTATLQWLGRHHDQTIGLTELGRNTGIAAAQNVGIDQARQQGCTHILLLDHDSVPAADMVARLLGALRLEQARGIPVAAVGPRYLDERQDNPPPFIRIRGLRVERCLCASADSVVPVDYLIASGSLIPVATIDRVGSMAEALFIDYVDIEWGLRARSKGFQSFGVCGALMAHPLGDTPIRFLGRNYPQHSPLRHYYHFRNAVWLYRHADLPRNWKLADGWRLVLKYGFYATLATPRREHLLMMSRGVVDGWRGRLGALQRPDGP